MITDNIFICNLGFQFFCDIFCDASGQELFISSWQFPARSSACSHLLEVWWSWVAYHVQTITALSTQSLGCPTEPDMSTVSHTRLKCSWSPLCQGYPSFIRKSGAVSNWLWIGMDFVLGLGHEHKLYMWLTLLLTENTYTHRNSVHL